VDAILITHAHADHILGLNDLTAMNERAGVVPKLFAHPSAHATIRKVFFYAFEGYNGVSSIPQFEVLTFGDSQFEACGLQVQPVRVEHAGDPCFGFRVGSFAYVTDAGRVPPESLGKLRGLDTLVLNALRFRKPHPTHLTVEGALEVISAVSPRRAFLTHLGHKILHQRDSARLPSGVEFAFDGLTFETGEPACVRS
jgi:phosphoribosyl 1,2-cyclic phosphate phosphodiesterase